MKATNFYWREIKRPQHEVISYEYPLYEGYSTQEAKKAYDNAVKEKINVHWYINGNLYRVSGKPSGVAV